MSEFEEQQHTDDKVSSPASLLDKVLSSDEGQLHPWADAVFPSKGAYYDDLIPGGVIRIKPMGLYADKVLSTQRLVRTGEALDHIFKKYVELPNDFNHLDLLTDDRVFLLYYLRGITHGNEYEFVVTCPHCGGTAEQEYDFNDLWQTATGPNPELGPEPFKIVLPYLTETLGEDFWIKIRFLRGRDSMAMLGASNKNSGMPGRARNRKKKGRQEAFDEIKEFGNTLDETLEKNIDRIIVEVMGETSRSKIKQLVERLHSTDVATIMDFLRENSPGIDTMIEADCNNSMCGLTMTVPLPITESFFRPKRNRRTRE